MGLDVVKQIRKATRRKSTADEKIRVVLEGLRGEIPVTELCRREGIHPTIYYKWSKSFLEAGKNGLTRDTHRDAIARAIVRQPNVFLLDESLSNLDARLRLSTRSRLKALQKELRVTTIYVTHDQTEAMSLGDRIAVMKDGRIEQVDRPQDLYGRPVTPFVAGFVGSPPMNLVEGACMVEGENLFISLADGSVKIPVEGAAALDKLEAETSCLEYGRRIYRYCAKATRAAIKEL